MARIRTLPASLLVLGLLAAASIQSRGPAEAAPRQVLAAAAAAKPNIVLIVVDDQPKDMIDIDVMPTVHSRIRERGLQLTNGIIPTSLCCPSRSSLLTGNHSHTTGVYTNEQSFFGAWDAFNAGGAERRTVATELSKIGYRTALIGKYLNGYAARGGSTKPPGWNRFIYMEPASGGDGAYYDYRLKGWMGTTSFAEPHLIKAGQSYDPADYSTDVLARHAADFVTATPAKTPLFLYWAPYGVHGPMTPADRDKGTWPLEPASAIPALNETDMTDKPAWLADNPEVDALEQRQKLTEQHEASMSVDDGIGRILDALGTRVSNTLIVYVSDNGYMLGSHRLTGKDMPHIRSTEVPMFLRWDGKIAPNTVLPRVTPQIDLTATIAQAAGITGWTMEGRSIFSTLAPPTFSGRAGTVVEQVESQDFARTDSRWHPSYCGWRTARYLFVEYGSGQGRELYDYDTDPDELTNRASDPAYASTLADLRALAIEACTPEPPGFDWG